MTLNDIYTGTVLWFNDQKGFGFVHVDNLDNNVFVHYTNIDSNKRFKKLYEGDVVQMNIEETDKGYVGSHVVTIARSDGK